MGKELIDYPNNLHHRQQPAQPPNTGKRLPKEALTLVGEHSGVSRTSELCGARPLDDSSRHKY